MQKPAHEIHFFDEFRLDLTRGCLFRGTLELKLRPQSFEVLKYLTQNQGRLVSKDELIESVWKGMAVTDDSLVQCMKDIRRALGDNTQQLITTVPRRGYIFESDVSENRSATYSEETSGIHLVIEETVDEALPAAVTRARSLTQSVRRHKFGAAVSLALLVVASSAAAYGVFLFLRRPVGPPFRSVSIMRLTTEGNAPAVSISPDGNYVAYVVTDKGQDSIWVRQIADVNPKQLVPPAADGYGGLVFSPDNNFVFYRQKHVLFKTPVLGGASRKVLEDVDSAIAFAPDGERIAFIRGEVADGEQRLTVASADGSGEAQTIAVRKLPQFFAFPLFGTGVAWSPDGSVIACPAGDNAEYGDSYPLEVRVADGAQKPLTTKRWNAVVQVAWLDDGSGLLMNAKDNGMDATRQIWHVSYPEGEPQRIYNDDKEYDRMSFAAKPGLLVSSQREEDSTIWSVDPHDGSAKQITTGNSRQDGYWGMDTAPDGRIVFDSRAGGAARDLWSVDSDGTNQRQITYDQLYEAWAQVSPDGMKILFYLGGKGLWIMDSVGANRRQLTDAGISPSFSADGRWVYYTLARDKWSLWRIPVDGGEAVRIVDQYAVHADSSPDGRLLAYVDTTPGVGSTIKIMPIDGGVEPQELPARGKDILGGIRWTPDGKAVTHRLRSNGIDQIVNQSLDGRPPEVVFTSRSETENIRGFAWSRQGERLYISLGNVTRSVVLFTLEK